MEERKKGKHILKFNVFGYYYNYLLWCELFFKGAMFGIKSIFKAETLMLLIFLIPVAAIFSLISKLFKNRKVNFGVTIFTSAFILFWYSLNFIFKKLFNTFFCVSILTLSDQALAFADEVVSQVIRNFYGVIIFLIPLIFIILFRKRFSFKKLRKVDLFTYILCIIVGMTSFFGFSFIGKDKEYSIYKLFNEVENNALNMEKLGVLPATYLDLKRLMFGFSEEVKIEKYNEIINEDVVTEIVYDYNNVDIDFESLLSNTTDQTLKTMHEYFSSDPGTLQNEYTGMYKDKNLIVVMGESLNTIAISEKYTPTLYKLTHSGLQFTNFYTPVNLSTIGGEFQDLTGLFANLNDLNGYWRKGTNYFPYGLGTMYKNQGYDVYAYHANSGYFQDRNVYLKNLGFDYFEARYMGLEKKMNCGIWPQSDLDMINATYDEWINQDHFMTYYVSVSGHMPYTKGGNYMTSKNWSLVSDMEVSDDAKGYVAANIELDRALESLIQKLEEAGKLDDTVIAVIPDHYPYSLDLSTINELSDYKRDGVIEINHSSLILWNNQTEDIVIDKVASQLDFIPTLYNLFGLEYDSRLFMGKDILSTSMGLAYFTNYSFVTNKGRYYASNNTFVPNDGEEVPDDYVNTVKGIVSNRIKMSKLIIEKDYYRKVIK